MKRLIIAIIFVSSIGLTAILTKNTTDNTWIMARIDEELGGDPQAPVKRLKYFNEFKRRFAVPVKL